LMLKLKSGLLTTAAPRSRMTLGLTKRNDYPVATRGGSTKYGRGTFGRRRIGKAACAGNSLAIRRSVKPAYEVHERLAKP
jgi:hypothetical protein